MDSGVLGSPLSWAHRGPHLHQQVPGAHLEPISTGQETQREQAHPCPGKGPCCLGKLSSGWFLVYLLKMIIVFFFFHKGQGEGETLPMETGQRLSSRGYPGFSFGKCVFAKVGVAVGDRECEGVVPLHNLPPHPGHSDISFLPGTFCQDTGALSSRWHDIQERNTLPVFYFVFQQRE